MTPTAEWYEADSDDSDRNVTDDITASTPEPARGFSDADLLTRRTAALNRTSAENERLRAKVSQYERDLNITGDEFDVAELRAEVERLREDKATFERWRDQWILTTEERETVLARAEDRAEAAEAKLRDVEAERDALRAVVEQARQWIVNCVDPAAVGVEVKRDMLATLARSQAPQAPAEQEGAHDAAGCDAWSCPIHGEANRDAAETRWFAKQIAEQEGIAAMARDFSRWLNGTYPADVSEEAVHWRRVLKVCEEAGEVRAALGAYLHENPRKPAGSLDDVISELADCAT